MALATTRSVWEGMQFVKAKYLKYKVERATFPAKFKFLYFISNPLEP